MYRGLRRGRRRSQHIRGTARVRRYGGDRNGLDFCSSGVQRRYPGYTGARMLRWSCQRRERRRDSWMPQRRICAPIGLPVAAASKDNRCSRHHTRFPHQLPCSAPETCSMSRRTYLRRGPLASARCSPQLPHYQSSSSAVGSSRTRAVGPELAPSKPREGLVVVSSGSRHSCYEDAAAATLLHGLSRPLSFGSLSPAYSPLPSHHR